MGQKRASSKRIPSKNIIRLRSNYLVQTRNEGERIKLVNFAWDFEGFIIILYFSGCFRDASFVQMSDL